MLILLHNACALAHVTPRALHTCISSHLDLASDARNLIVFQVVRGLRSQLAVAHTSNGTLVQQLAEADEMTTSLQQQLTTSQDQVASIQNHSDGESQLVSQGACQQVSVAQPRYDAWGTDIELKKLTQRQRAEATSQRALSASLGPLANSYSQAAELTEQLSQLQVQLADSHRALEQHRWENHNSVAALQLEVQQARSKADVLQAELADQRHVLEQQRRESRDAQVALEAAVREAKAEADAVRSQLADRQHAGMLENQQSMDREAGLRKEAQDTREEAGALRVQLTALQQSLMAATAAAPPVSTLTANWLYHFVLAQASNVRCQLTCCVCAFVDD